MSDLWHALTCPFTSRWNRRRWHIPFWKNDSVAAMLGIQPYGCRRCGRGAAIEMAVATGDDTHPEKEND